MSSTNNASNNVKFNKLFEAGLIGGLELRNRIVMPAMGTNFGSHDGSVTQRMIDYYEERAKGGVGLIIVEVTGVEYPRGRSIPANLSIHDDSLIPAHSLLVEAIHAQGAKIAVQLFHAGVRSNPLLTGQQAVGPSAIPCKILGAIPRELTIEEIHDLIKKFGEAAVRAKKIGYDAIELHGAHGHLLAQFMSSYFNWRRDWYGGSLENRLRFPKEIVREIRGKLGDDYPIIFRLSGDEFVSGGRGLEESVDVALMMEEVGVSAIHLTAGIRETYQTAIEPMPYEQGWKIYMAETIKKAVHVPVIGVGVIREPQFAEDILRGAKADFVSIGRGLIADPQWPLKAVTGRENEIRRCISCNTCFLRVEQSLPVRCAINPRVGSEGQIFKIRPAMSSKRIIVVGGGPAGMVAALATEKMGHRVSLYEKRPELGGQLRLASRPPGKDKIKWFLEYLMRKIEKRNIEVILGNEATPETILGASPDVVVIATGAIPLIPDIPGISTESAYTAWEILENARKIEGKVVLIIGGGSVGCETALYLAPKNKKVIVAEMLDQISPDSDSLTRADLASRIKDFEVELLLGTKVKRIESHGVIVTNRAGKEKLIQADRVVLAAGVSPLDHLKSKIQGKVRETYCIGDSYKPRKIIDAVREGFNIALRIQS